ncbi:ligand-binding sensor domain-containing protein, partial [Sinomicrobium weinanense]
MFSKNNSQRLKKKKVLFGLFKPVFVLQKAVCLLLFCVLTGFQSMEDNGDIRFSYITSEQGLDSDECNFVFEDSEGFLWIGTNGGLFRYDGYELLNFENIVRDTNNIIGKSKYLGIAEGKDDVLWIASSQGVYSYHRKTSAIELLIKSEDIFDVTISDARIAIAYDPAGKVWLGGTKGIFIYDLEREKFEYFNSIKGQRVRGVKDIMVSSSGDIWIATWGDGLGRYDPSGNTFDIFEGFTRGPDTDQHNVLSALYEDDHGDLWTGTWGDGLYRLDITAPDNPRILDWFYIDGREENPGLPSYIIYDISEDIRGRIWVGTPFGISILKKSSQKEGYTIRNHNSREENEKLNNNEVKSITRGSSGLMWLSTYGGGINKVDLRKDRFPLFHIATEDPIRKSQSVYAFTRDSKDRLFLGIHSLGFGIYDTETNIFTPYTDIPDYRPLADFDINTVRNFTWDKKGDLWLGTRYKGLIKYNVERKEYIAVGRSGKGLPLFKEVFQVRLDLKNNLWSLTNKGIFHVVQSDDFKSCDVQPFEPVQADSCKPIDAGFSDFVIDRGGYFYLATKDGNLWKSTESIYEAVQDLYFKEIRRPGQKNKSINSLFVDSRQKLWVGTNNGLEVYGKNGKPHNTNLLSEINNLSVHSMEEDERGNLLVTSNKGVIYINITSGNPDHKIFTTRNGLQANFFIKDVIYKDTEGGIYIGGHRGFNYINPIEITDELNLPALVFTNLQNSSEVYFNSDGFSKETPFRIPYDDNIISITFASLDLRNPESLYYAYKLEGLEEEWKYVSSGNRTATYVNLPPGNYTFKVKGTNSSGQWSPQTIELPVYVQTAPYLTWWAYTLYALLSL